MSVIQKAKPEELVQLELPRRKPWEIMAMYPRDNGHPRLGASSTHLRDSVWRVVIAKVDRIFSGRQDEGVQNYGHMRTQVVSMVLVLAMYASFLWREVGIGWRCDIAGGTRFGRPGMTRGIGYGLASS